MKSRILVFTFALVLGTAAFGTALFNTEKGSRSLRTRLSAGDSHVCAILDDGTVHCWGRNDSGQLGDGTTVNRSSPVPVSNLSTAVSIAAGQNHTCALLSSGVVRCWGDNSSGQLGNGTLTSSTTPVAVSGLVNVVSIAVGLNHSCAVVVDGIVHCWGDNQIFQSGGFSARYLVPSQVQTVSGAIQVVAGSFHTCALLVNGTAMCWGENGFGELGTGDTRQPTGPVLTLPLAPFPEEGALALEAHLRFTCAHTSAGLLMCWGNNGHGQLGINLSISNFPFPTVINTPHDVAAFSTGTSHACAILLNGRVTCWGSDNAGQLGDGGSVDNAAPGPAVPGVDSALEITGGGGFTCALVAGGAIHCWGANNFGQHGNGTTTPSGTDSVVGINGTFLGRGVTAGMEFTCARRGTSVAACWGEGSAGQLGYGISGDSSNPFGVIGIANATGLAAGGAHACSTSNPEFIVPSLSCWGSNGYGQLGNVSTPVTGTNQPGAVFGGPYIAVSAGLFHTCALQQGGIVFCWGANYDGQLGIGRLGDISTPVTQGLFLARAVAAGGNFSCALLIEGTVSCWGSNFSGELGHGATEAFSPNPTAVPGLANIVSITAGARHACALTSWGAVLCWGDNSRGQIGNNTSNNRMFFPTAVQGLSDAIAVSAGGSFTCALRAGGTVSCWGANDAGQLSTVDSLDHLTPSPVGRYVFCGIFCPGGRGFFPILGAAAIATGSNFFSADDHACALMATGVIDCWGANSHGEIGDGTTTNRTGPTVVNSFAANVDPAATLRNGRIAEVTALINCDAGDQAHIVLTLDQGASSGTGHADAACDGRLLQVPMNVPAQGPSGFQAGTATAHVEAIVRREGAILDDTHWTRQVVISVSN